MFVFTLLVFTTLVVRGSSLTYYFTYYLDHAELRTFLGNFGLASVGNRSGWGFVLDSLGLIVTPDGANAPAVGLSFFFVSGVAIRILGVLASRRLSDRFGKKAVFLAGMGLSTVATALVFVVPPGSIWLLYVVSMLWPLGWGPTIPLLWVMIADVADYSEWKTSRRATGFMYAGILFALKAGLGLGGALSGWLLAAYGYVPDVAQTPRALLGIRLSATVYAAVPFVLGLVCLAMYPIGKELNQRIQDELTERRKKFATEV